MASRLFLNKNPKAFMREGKINSSEQFPRSLFCAWQKILNDGFSETKCSLRLGPYSTGKGPKMRQIIYK